MIKVEISLKQKDSSDVDSEDCGCAKGLNERRRLLYYLESNTTYIKGLMKYPRVFELIFRAINASHHYFRHPAIDIKV